MRKASFYTPQRLPPGLVRHEHVNRNFDDIAGRMRDMVTEYRAIETMRRVKSYAAARSLRGQDGETIGITGRELRGDGGEGQFYWDPTLSTDDGGTTLKSSSGAGGWRRVIAEYIRPEWWGANSSKTNNSAAVQSAFNLSYSLGKATLITGHLLCADPLYLPPPDPVDPAPSITIVGGPMNNASGLGIRESSILEYTAIDGTAFITLELVTSGSYLYSVTMSRVALVGPDVADVYSAAPRSGHGLWIRYDPLVGIGTFVFLDNLTAIGFKGGSGLRLEGCNGSVLKGVQAIRCGVGIEGINGFNGNTLIGCSTQNNINKGAYFSSSYGTSWTGGTIQNLRDGIVCDNLSAFTFSGLYFEGNNAAKLATQNAFRVEDTTGTSSAILVIGGTFGGTAGDTALVKGTAFVPSNVRFIGCRIYDTVSATADGVGPGRRYVVALDVCAQSTCDGMGPQNTPGAWYKSPNNSNASIDPQELDLAGSHARGGDGFKAQTTNATPIALMSHTMPANKACAVRAYVTVVRTGGARATGAVGDTVSYTVDAAAKASGGAPAPTLSPITTTTREIGTGDLSTATVVTLTPAANGVIQVTATGSASLDVTWAVRLEITALT